MLSEIISTKKEELEFVKREVSIADLKSRAKDMDSCRGFASALSCKLDKGRSYSRIIAEIKKASPSKGVLRKDFDPVELASIYEKGNASAISCLTESIFFLGALKYIAMIKNRVALPVLRKDFIVDEYQVYESRANGADAFLLIAAILDKNQLKEYCHMGCEEGMDVLVEIHKKDEIQAAVEASPQMIGINNRDLNTFATDIEVTQRLAGMIPKDKIVISESGIKSRADIVSLEKFGADAFLIGESLMKESDILSKLAELTGEMS